MADLGCIEVHIGESKTVAFDVTENGATVTISAPPVVTVVQGTRAADGSDINVSVNGGPLSATLTNNGTPAVDVSFNIAPTTLGLALGAYTFVFSVSIAGQTSPRIFSIDVLVVSNGA